MESVTNRSNNNTAADMHDLTNNLATKGSWGITTALAFGLAITVLAYATGHLSGGCVMSPPLDLRLPGILPAWQPAGSGCMAAAVQPPCCATAVWLLAHPRPPSCHPCRQINPAVTLGLLLSGNLGPLQAAANMAAQVAGAILGAGEAASRRTPRQLWEMGRQAGW